MQKNHKGFHPIVTKFNLAPVSKARQSGEGPLNFLERLYLGFRKAIGTNSHKLYIQSLYQIQKECIIILVRLLKGLLSKT